MGVPRLSVIIPARHEDERIGPVLDRLLASVSLPFEALVVVDDARDPTAAVVRRYAAADDRLACLVNPYGPGPANAIRYGIQAARAAVAVVTMADGCDDVRQIDELARLVEGGAAVAAASRYAPGGRQTGGPALKGLMSRAAGRSLQLLARPGTCDATNSFKAYSTAFAATAGVDSRHGFEIGIELTAKARRLRLPVAEIPTRWQELRRGGSNFKIIRSIPHYLRWYGFCFGPRLTAAQVRARCGRGTDGRQRILRPSGRRPGGDPADTPGLSGLPWGRPELEAPSGRAR
jgi:glycosyltransferase involved in cell wall biosynthesis